VNVLSRIVAALVVALVSWMEKRHAKSRKPIDADRRARDLDRVGRRVREWEDRARRGGQPDPRRTERERPGVHADRR
jgi:hypothetical protein